MNFNDFLVCLDKLPDSWDDRICLFVAQLIIENHPPPTIQSYVSAVKGTLRDDGIEIEDNSVALSALIRSSKQINRTESKTRLPIQKGLLRIKLDNIERHFLSDGNQLCTLVRCIKVCWSLDTMVYSILEK